MSEANDVDLSAEKYERYREAGEILATVLEEAEEQVTVGTSHLEVAEFAEDRIRELGGEPAFPVNISVNEEASHATPERDSEVTFGEDMVCLDIGVHVDGWIADAATTIDLTDTPELVEAAEAALEAALETVAAGVHTGEVGTAIETTIDDYGYNPIVNLSGHGLDEYDAHTGPNIPNRAVETGVELQVGDVVAIEPFATDGTGKVSEGSTEEIFSLVEEKSVRDRRARQLIETVTEEYQRLPFAVRWFDDDRAKMSLRRLKLNDVVRGYPVLKEDEGRLVSQAEHTVIVTEDGCEITTQ
ncbi:MAG: type II methionyl aminopeptidase [Halobacteriales archaeon]|nr:type II methionyl aminopeptidase [Halobacteriales archaeon]